MNTLVVLPLLIPLLLGALILTLHPRRLSWVRAISIGGVVGQLVIAVTLACGVADGSIFAYRLGDWPAHVGIVLVADRLTALMLVLTGALALPALLHACSTDGDRAGPGFHALFQFQLLGLAGAFLTGDLFNLFVFFEILLIASYGLLLHGGGAARTRAGMHYVVLNLVGSALFLVAVGALYGVAGTLNMADLARRMAHMPEAEAVVMQTSAFLLLAVFGLKAALVPLHFWLTPAYAAAAAPVAALFAIMTKVGVYAMLRIYTLVFDATAVAPFLFTLALITLAIGAVGLLASRDLREQVAWLVVISVGTLLAGIALFTPGGISGALYYLVHTTLVTGGLFLLADIAGARREGTRLEPGGRPPHRGLIGALFLMGGASAAGLPPFSGFIGKLLVLQSGFGTPVLVWLWGTVLAGGLAAVLALSRAGSVLFWKSDDAPVVAPPGRVTLLPAAALISASVWMALAAGPLSDHATATAAQLLAPERYISAVFPGEARP